ncbi:LINE-1 reverse transcriptase like, partial [Trifolium medium]|nr:LINE-1 reverse transcriptase like [Trifolium medium]
VGANPRLSSTWDPVVKTIEKRLLSWKHRYVSLGGRVVLLNSVLASIPVFFLSYLKLPSMVRKKIIRIQRNFLWGGALGEKAKIPWVSWKDVCRPKKEGGLGVKDLLLFNVSLLAKWRWRLLVEDGSLWKKVLEAKYGGVGKLTLSLNRGNKSSLWWKDLVGLGGALGGTGDWTQEVFAKMLGNGGATSFWLDLWVGREPLCDAFPRLYNVSLQPNGSVLEMGFWENDTWFWRL